MGGQVELPLEPAPWEVLCLGEVATIDRRSVKAETIQDGTRYVGLEHIDPLTGVSASIEVSHGELASAKFAYGPEHILYGKLRPYLRKIARPEDAGVCSTDILPVRAGPTLDRDFLYHYLRQPSIVHHVNSRCTGANLPRAHPKVLEAIPVPIPQLTEQRRIAAILNKADTIRRKRNQAIGLFDQLLRSTFLEMFGDPVTNPKGWPMSTFEEQLTHIKYGPRFYNQGYSDEGIRVVRITDLDSLGALDFEAMPRLAVTKKDIARSRLHAGDVVFARSGATVGKTAVVKPEDPPCIAGAYFIVMRFGEHVAPTYAQRVLASASIQRIIESGSRQSAQQNFSGPSIKRLPLPMPPADLQQAFECVASRIRSLRVRIVSQPVDDLFESLAQRAFRGEL